MKDPRKAPPCRRSAGVAVLGFLVVASALSVAPASAEELGRLFLTPQQRQELDWRRQTNFVERETVVESLVTVNGRVIRSSGRTTTWINGVPEDDTYRSADPARVEIGRASCRERVYVLV